MNNEILNSFIEALQRAGKPKTSAYDTTATVRRIENGIAWVHIPGGVDETPVKLTINAEAGDTVQVRVSGGTAFLVGNGTAPPTDDKQANIATEIAESAKAVAATCVKSIKTIVHNINILDTAVQEARAIADATNQHFWTDDSGAHVSTVEGQAAQGKNLLMNSLGILLRNADKNLAQFSESQVAFYDGDGNNEENIVAVFGKDGAQVGYASSGHLNLSSNSIQAVSDAGTDMFAVGSNQTRDIVLVTKTINAVKGVRSSSSSSPTSLFVVLPITQAQTGGSLKIECEGYGTSFNPQSTFRVKKTFECVIGTNKIQSFYPGYMNFTLMYNVTNDVHSLSANIYSTASGYIEYFKVTSISYDGYMMMPTYNFGTRAISDNYPGSFSTVIGESLYATGDRQTAIGKYNVEDTADTYAQIIGNGTSDAARSNAHCITWDGDEHIALDSTEDLYTAITALGWGSEVIV